MPVTVIATPGAADANSYATLAEAEAYIETRPASWAETSGWANAEEDDKNRALVTATELLDEYVRWSGRAATTTQVLGWPRACMRDLNRKLIAEDVIPARLRYATIELAAQLLSTDRTADSDADTQGLKSLKAGPVALEFKDSIQAKPIPDRVWQMVALWGELLQGWGAATLARA